MSALVALSLTFVAHMVNLAGIAVTHREDKYAALSINYDLIMMAIKTLGPISTITSTFLRELGRRLTIATENPRETSFLFQRIFVAVQQFNTIRIRSIFSVQFKKY